MGTAKTTFSLSRDAVSAIQADGLVIPVFQSRQAIEQGAEQGAEKGAEKKQELPVSEAVIWPLSLPAELKQTLETVMEEEKFKAAKGKLLTFRPASSQPSVRRIVLMGMGDAAKSRLPHWESGLQKAMAVILGLKDAHSAAIFLPDAQSMPGLPFLPAELIPVAVDAVDQATYRSAEAKEPSPDLRTVTLLLPEGSNPSPADLEARLQQAKALSSARSLVKDLVNRPANLKSTRTLVDEALRLGADPLLETHVQEDVSWIEQSMPCFYTVARGSLATDPPKFVTLRYQPPTGKAAKKHVAVVGKSVIFDTGGYQVKPGDYMVTMKGDMTGGAVALAVMQALAELKPEHIEVSAYLAATPNKIDSDAMVPDSIVNTTCGKRVEIRHTDAEGRLTLIDAVAKAVENHPDEIITIATLTGSASQAVGCAIALMGRDEALRDRLAAAGRSQGEPIQTLDVIEDDYDNIKSKLDGADLINTSQRKNRGAQTAAAFVMSGAPEDIPMAHLDIAGADMTPDEKATGISVKTVLQYLLNENERLAAL